jgi:hypothetical protein
VRNMKIRIVVEFENEGKIKRAERIVPEMQSYVSEKSFMAHLNEGLLGEEEYETPGTSDL